MSNSSRSSLHIEAVEHLELPTLIWLERAWQGKIKNVSEVFKLGFPKNDICNITTRSLGGGCNTQLKQMSQRGNLPRRDEHNTVWNLWVFCWCKCRDCALKCTRGTVPKREGARLQKHMHYNNMQINPHWLKELQSEKKLSLCSSSEGLSGLASTPGSFVDLEIQEM